MSRPIWFAAHARQCAHELVRTYGSTEMATATITDTYSVAWDDLNRAEPATTTDGESIGTAAVRLSSRSKASANSQCVAPSCLSAMSTERSMPTRSQPMGSFSLVTSGLSMTPAP